MSQNQNSRVSAASLTFGVEIETHVPVTSHEVGYYHRGIPVPFLPAGWKCEHDRSIHTSRSNRKACEYISPILSGAEGIRQVYESVQKIAANGAEVNSSCGVHVTIGWTGDLKALERLISLVANFEKALYASSGTTSRERGHYCKGIKADHANAKEYADKHGKSDYRNSPDRYRLLNITHLANYGNRVEFRVFSGSVNPEKIVAWIMLCLTIVEKALNSSKSSPWNSTSKGNATYNRAGKGQTEMARCLYILGWTQARALSDSVRDLFAGLPVSMDTCKTQLMRLAAKYDGPVATEPVAETTAIPAVPAA